jgi:chorismate dehydratase
MMALHKDPESPNPIAMIPYANMAPYEVLGPPQGCCFVQCHPRNSIQALQSAAVWAAAVPVGGLPVLKDVVTPVGSFGIAAFREVMSVLFFSRRPLSEFGPAMTVRLTDESASSVRLLYLLMQNRLGRERIPALAASGETADGELVIGDTALQWLHVWETQGHVKTYPHVTDLASLWHRLCELPFVFARWVVRTDAPESVRRGLHRWLESFSLQEPALIEQAVCKTAARLNLPHDYVHRYLKIIRRCLTPLDEAGQARFAHEWRLAEQAGPGTWFAAAPRIDSQRNPLHAQDQPYN